jgi:hypothetical protein
MDVEAVVDYYIPDVGCELWYQNETSTKSKCIHNKIRMK